MACSIKLGKRIDKYGTERNFVWNLGRSEDKEYTSTTLLVNYGSPVYLRFFMKNVVQSCAENKEDIELICCDLDNENRFDFNNYHSVENIANMIEDVVKLVFSRFKVLEENAVNNIRHLEDSDKYKNIVLCISNTHKLMHTDDYESLQKIEQGLTTIARLGRAVGIHSLILTDGKVHSSLTDAIINNCSLRLSLGEINEDDSNMLFNEDVSGKKYNNIDGYVKFMNDDLESVVLK